MGWRVLFVKESEVIKLKLNNLEISKLGKKYYVPVSDINVMVVEGNTSLTTNVLNALSKENAVVILCDEKYMPATFILNYGGYHHFAKRSLNQSTWTDDLKKEAWRNIVMQKMMNQVQMAEKKLVPQERLDLMLDLATATQNGDATNREGMVAKVYFNSLYGMGFSREDDDEIENMAMNYGYAIIRAAIARAVIGQGLIPVFGIFHKNEYNPYNLVDDLMEPFRPLMDYWLHTKILGKDDYLSYAIRLNIIDFLNQPMYHKGRKSDVSQVIEKYISSFVKAMTSGDVEKIIKINLQDFVEANGK